MVTAGRVLLAAVLPSRAAYHGLPFLLAAAFVLIAALPSHAPAAAMAAFYLAGLGYSALPGAPARGLGRSPIEKTWQGGVKSVTYGPIP